VLNKNNTKIGAIIMMQLVILMRERAWENQKWTDLFRVANSENPEETMRTAIKEYLLTDEGKEDIKQSSEEFNWGDAVMYVPESVWNKHGIISVSEGEQVKVTNTTVIEVDQDEVLIPKEYYQEEE